MSLYTVLGWVGAVIGLGLSIYRHVAFNISLWEAPILMLLVGATVVASVGLMIEVLATLLEPSR